MWMMCKCSAIEIRRQTYNLSQAINPFTERLSPVPLSMKRFWLLFSQSVTVLLAAYFVVATLKPGWLNLAGPNRGTVAVLEAPTPTLGSVPVGSFRLAAQKSSSAVVSINTSKNARQSPHSSDPWFQIFLRRAGGPAPGRPGQRRDRECRRLHPDQQPCGGKRRRNRGHPQRQSACPRQSDRHRPRIRPGRAQNWSRQAYR
jgi:S1-C subfamily serine protease